MPEVQGEDERKGRLGCRTSQGPAGAAKEVRGSSERDRVVEEDVGGVGEEHEVLAIRRRGLHRRRQQALAQREDLLELPDHLGVEEASKLFGRYFKTCRLLFYCWCIRVKSY